MSSGPQSPLFLADIVAQPAQLRELALRMRTEAVRAPLEAAEAALSVAPFVAIVGIGASFGAGLLLQNRLSAAGRPAALFDASELLHFGQVPDGAAAVLVSRSGRSVELVALGQRLAASGVRLIVVTNDPASPLAGLAEIVLDTAVSADHLLSVKSCSAAMLMIAMLGELVAGGAIEASVPAIVSALDSAEAMVTRDWLPALDRDAARIAAATSHYFLARGGAMSAALAARLLWEEAAKSPATAMTTGSFRHGSQEMLSAQSLICAWLDPHHLRGADLATLRAMRRLGYPTLIIGQDVPDDAADCVLSLPDMPATFAPIAAMMPGQLAAHRFAVARGVDADTFRLCGSVVESEQGLGPGDA